jgi:hypothetical protein
MEDKKLYKKGFSVATIGILLASIFATIVPAMAQVPLPPNYTMDEKSWLKQDGMDASTWAMYNNTGWNRLNLTYRSAKANLAYVVASTNPTDDIDVTFWVWYNNSEFSDTNYFNTTGHLFGNQSNTSFMVWSNTVPSVTAQTTGATTYYLFTTTFDPSGNPGMYQVRVNGTGTLGTIGADPTDPMGNPDVHWMFFQVPTVSTEVELTDQLGRSHPFYLDGDSPSTQFNATYLVPNPPGNTTGGTSAKFVWKRPDGTIIEGWGTADDSIPIYYIPGQGWATQWTIAANTSTFPFNATHPYSVTVEMGAYSGTTDFFVLSTEWISVEITVEPTHGQWFDPSSFLVTFTAIVNTGLPNNPYTTVDNVTLQFWDRVHVDLEPSGDPDGIPEWYGGQPGDPAGNPVFANLSWDISGYIPISGSSYTYVYQKMIPWTYIDNSTDEAIFRNRFEEFFGWYAIKSKPSAGEFPACIASTEFYVDDPLEGYTSLEKASTNAESLWEQKPGTVWVNVEYDPVYLRTRQHDNAEYAPDQLATNITWYYQSAIANPNPATQLIRPPGHDVTTMTQSGDWPSDQYWAFSTANVNSSNSWFPTGTYDIVANATTRRGYTVYDLITWQVVYRVLYLEIEPKWDVYNPCMKKSIIGKTYYLDEYMNEVPVEWGFMVTKLIDPNGITYLDMVDDSSSGEGDLEERFAWTVTRLVPGGAEAWGAVWDEIPSDAEEGTWTVHAMALGIDSDEWESTNSQSISIGGTSYSYQGPDITTFEVTGTDVHLMIDGILDGVDEGFNLTWEVLADILANQDDMAAANAESFEAVISMLDDVLAHMVEQDAVLDSIDDYVREIRALTQRIDRWRTDMAEDLVDHFQEIRDAVNDVNNNVNGKWAAFGDTWQTTIYGVNDRDPRSLSYKINNVRSSVDLMISDSLGTMVSKMDTVYAGLVDKLTNILNTINSESGGLDASIRSEIRSNIEYAIKSLREKVDQSTVVLGTKITSAHDSLDGKFSGVISAIGHVGEKVDVVNSKLGGMETNINDKVDSVDSSVGTKLLVAIILIVIVLILVLLPIVAPGFRMKE